ALGTWGLGTGGLRSKDRTPGTDDARSANTRVPSLQSLVPILAFIAGALVWAIPLVLITGGPAAYWHALFDQGAEDLGNIQMLWTRHGVRDIADAFYFAFIAPWAIWPIAAIVLTRAALVIAWLGRYARQ